MVGEHDHCVVSLARNNEPVLASMPSRWSTSNNDPDRIIPSSARPPWLEPQALKCIADKDVIPWDRGARPWAGQIQCPNPTRFNLNGFAADCDLGMGSVRTKKYIQRGAA